METKVFIVIAFLSIFVNYSLAAGANCKIFAFGDSNTDVGENCAVYGIISKPLPGRKGKASCRASDGLLYIDFICASLGMTNLLSPYLEPLGADFSNGADFAMFAAVALDMPFGLPTQINQFARFQYRVKELMKEGKGPAITQKDFTNSIFSVDIGQNNIGLTLTLPTYNHTDLVTNVIPTALKSIENATRTLYGLGARKIVLHNTGPLGCLPAFLGHIASRGLHSDTVGCVAEYNDLAMLFNDGLASIATQLRREMKDVTLAYVDMYAIKFDLIRNASKYGFEKPLEACLGSSGSVCLDPSRAVSWDGIHYSQAANKVVASRIMAGHDSFPYTPLKLLCEQRESS